MGAVGPTTAIADRPHRVTLQNPGPAVPDGDGGYAQSWIDLAPPALSAKIAPATARDLEKVAAGTVLSTASHIVTMPYHPQVTTKTRILFNGRVFNVTGVATPDEGGVETIAICAEVVA
jgi:head-tail adaptor